MAPKDPRQPASHVTPKHQWTEEDRTILAVIYKFYDTSRDVTTSIFNRMRHHRLIEEGFHEGLTPGAIMAQTNDLKRTTRGTQFQKIQSMSIGDARQNFHAQRDEIEAAAQHLGIALKLSVHLSNPDEISPPKRGPTADCSEWSSDSESESESESAPMGRLLQVAAKSRANKRVKTSSTSPEVKVRQFHMQATPSFRSRETTHDSIITELSETSFQDSCSSGSWDSEANTTDGEDCPGVDDNDFAREASRIKPTLSLNFNEKGKIVQRRPRLLFRAFEPGHGLCARAFLESVTLIPPPPPYGNPQFEDLAYRHLVQDIFKSPFLSWTQSPKRALEKHIVKDRECRTLAVLDYNVLEDDIKKRYGKGAGPWLVPDLCDNFEWDDLVKIKNAESRDQAPSKRKGYRGNGEFLVWGAVLCEPVAVFEYRDALRLCDIMNTISEVNYAAGMAIKPCLYGVRDIYKAVLARKLLHAFEVPGYEKGYSCFDFEDFVHGIYGEPSEAKVQIVIEIPASVPRPFMNPNSALVYLSSNIRDREENLQQMVDSQLSMMGSEYGVMIVPRSLSPVLTMSQSEETFLSTQYVGDARQGSLINKAEDKKFTFEETIKKVDVKTEGTVSDEEYRNHKPIIQPSPGPDLDVFTRQLLDYALIPTPSPLPKYLNSIKAETDTNSAKDTPSQQSTPAPHMAASTAQEYKAYRTDITTVDTEIARSPTQSYSSSIVQILNDIKTSSKATVQKPQKALLSQRERPQLAASLFKSSSSPSTIDLTVKESRCIQSRAPGAPRKINAPETLTELQNQVRLSDKTAVDLAIHDEILNSQTKNKQASVRNQRGNVTNPDQAAISTSTGDEDEVGNDEVEIVSETVRTHHRQIVRTTTQFQTKTKLTIRSRSLSEGITLKRRRSETYRAKEPRELP